MVQHLQETAHLLYVPPRTVCIDEGLVRYNGKCKLKVYEPSKPGCYGIKMYLLCDTDKHYTYYIDMYRKGGPPLHTSGQKIVDRLITGARISEGHALVADRFFTSVATAEALLQRGITFTGTCQERRRFVPKILTKQEMRRNPEIVEMSSLTVFSENMSITGYIPARHYHRNFKVVLVLSTEYQLHHQVNS